MWNDSFEGIRWTLFTLNWLTLQQTWHQSDFVVTTKKFSFYIWEEIEWKFNDFPSEWVIDLTHCYMRACEGEKMNEKFSLSSPKTPNHFLPFFHTKHPKIFICHHVSTTTTLKLIHTHSPIQRSSTQSHKSSPAFPWAPVLVLFIAQSSFFVMVMNFPSFPFFHENTERSSEDKNPRKTKIICTCSLCMNISMNPWIKEFKFHFTTCSTHVIEYAQLTVLNIMMRIFTIHAPLVDEHQKQKRKIVLYLKVSTSPCVTLINLRRIFKVFISLQ